MSRSFALLFITAPQRRQKQIKPQLSLLSPPVPYIAHMAHSADHGGAAQPAWSSSGAAQPAFSALPNNAPELGLGFYNVGIQLGEVGGNKWHRKEQRLRRDIVDAFVVHDLDVLCLSELGEQGRGLGSKLPNHDRATPPAVDAWLLGLLSDSAAPPVSVYSDGHYATLVKTRRVSVEKYEFVRGFVRGQEERGFQHVRVHFHGDDTLISIINCHAASSITNKK